MSLEKENNDEILEETAEEVAEETSEEEVSEEIEDDWTPFRSELADIAAENPDKKGPWRLLVKLIRGLTVHPTFKAFRNFIGDRGVDLIRFIVKNWDVFEKIILEVADDLNVQRGRKLGADDIDDVIKNSFLHFVKFAKDHEDEIDLTIEWIGKAIRLAVLVLQIAGKLP